MPFAERTRVPVAKTRTEIEQLLQRHKALQFGSAVDYQTRQARVQFRLHDRIVRFVIALPDPARLRGDRFDQAERQKWRALLLAIRAKLESVASGIETFEQAFLAHVVLPNDLTVAETLRPFIASAYADGRMPRALVAGSEAQP